MHSGLDEVSNLSDALVKLLQANGKLDSPTLLGAPFQPGRDDRPSESWSTATPAGVGTGLQTHLPQAHSTLNPSSGLSLPLLGQQDPSWGNYNLWSAGAAGSTGILPSQGLWQEAPQSTAHLLSQPQPGLEALPLPSFATLAGNSQPQTAGNLASLSLLQQSPGWQTAQQVQLPPHSHVAANSLHPGLLQQSQTPLATDAALWQQQYGTAAPLMPNPAVYRAGPHQTGLHMRPALPTLQTVYDYPGLHPQAAAGPNYQGTAVNALSHVRQPRVNPRLEQGVSMVNGREASSTFGAMPPFLKGGWTKGAAQQGNARSGKSSKTNTAPVHRKPYSPLGAAGSVGTGPAAKMAVLDADLHRLVDELRPLPAEVEARTEAFELVRSILLARWSEAKVHVFGSTANTLSITNNNDIDMTLELPQLPDVMGAKAAVVEEIGRLFLQAGVKDVLLLPKALVPVVKLITPGTGTKIDLTVNNLLAIVNTKLLKDYAAIDGRLAQLVFVVKHWAKRRQVNDAYRGTLSSYCYVLMCIAHLQHRKPPILPCLQAMPSTFFRTVGRWSCDYHDQVEGLQGFGAANTETLAELVWSFFEFWAWRHDFNNSVVSVRTLTPVSKAEKEWTKRVGNERHLVSIEDPFELSHDLGRTMDRQTTSVLHKEFERAAGILCDDPDPLPRLFEPYRAVKYDGHGPPEARLI